MTALDHSDRVARAREVLEESRAAVDAEAVPYNAAAWAGRLDAALELLLAADKDGDVVLVSRADLKTMLDREHARHAHRLPGVWDRDGRPCEECAAGQRLRAALGEDQS